MMWVFWQVLCLCWDVSVETGVAVGRACLQVCAGLQVCTRANLGHRSEVYYEPAGV